LILQTFRLYRYSAFDKLVALDYSGQNKNHISAALNLLLPQCVTSHRSTAVSTGSFASGKNVPRCSTCRLSAVLELRHYVGDAWQLYGTQDYFAREPRIHTHTHTHHMRARAYTFAFCLVLFRWRCVGSRDGKLLPDDLCVRCKIARVELSN